MQTQSALATAESTLMSAMAAYEKSRIELDRAMGTTLDHAGISIDDAAKGQVNRVPNVPYVAPRKELPARHPQPTRPIVRLRTSWRRCWFTRSGAIFFRLPLTILYNPARFP